MSRKTNTSPRAIICAAHFSPKGSCAGCPLAVACWACPVAARLSVKAIREHARKVDKAAREIMANDAGRMAA